MKNESVSCVEAIKRSLVPHVTLEPNTLMCVSEPFLTAVLTPIFGNEVKESIDYLIKSKTIKRSFMSISDKDGSSLYGLILL